MSKKILFISDNPSILNRVEKEIIESYENFDSLVYEFCCSKFSNINDFRSVNSKITYLDLRNEDEVKKISKYYDLVFSIHCKQLFPKKLIDNVKCINVHPGYNPINRGWYPQVFAIIHDLDIGATIHEIDQKLDHGSIIARRKVNKLATDTSLDVYNRVVDEEIALLKQNFDDIINNRYGLIKPEGKGNLYLKKDFKELCKINLNETVTMKEAIDRLRALTHGEFKNAYFIDKETGGKIFIKLTLEK